MEHLTQRIREFYARNGRLPSVSTVRCWEKWRIGRQAAQRLIEAALSAAPTVPTVSTPARRELDVPFPAPRAPLLDGWPTLRAPALVFSDLHVPSHHEEWIRHIVSEALKKGVRRAVIVGDLLDFGHLSRYPKESRWSPQEELDDLLVLMQWLLQYMTEVHVLPGNHDDRLANKLDRKITTEWFLARMFQTIPGAPIVTHWHHHAYLGQRWLLAHPKTYSRTPTQPALELAKAFGRSVAVGHTHHFNVGRYYGRWAAEIGMTADARRMDYKQAELTTHPSAELGALLILEDERPVFLHPDLG